MASMTAQVARPVVMCKASQRTPAALGPAKPFTPALQRPAMSPCTPSLGLRSQARKQLRGVKIHAQDTETAAGRSIASAHVLHEDDPFRILVAAELVANQLRVQGALQVP